MRNRYILAIDVLLIALAAVGAFALRFDWAFFRTRADVWPFLVAALCVKPVVFLLLGMYRRYWHYAGASDFMLVLLSNAVASLILAVLVPVGMATGVISEFPRSAGLIDFFVCLAFTSGVRFFLRILNDSNVRSRKTTGGDRRVRPRRVLVVGAGEAGALVARESGKNPQLGLDIVGFLDDDTRKHNKSIAGIRVLGGLSSLTHVVKSFGVEEVVIAMPAAPGAVIRVMAETCRQLGVTSKTVPGVFELLGDRVSVRRLRDVHINDLLQRSPVANPADLGYLTDRTVLVTGAGGSIGSELCRQAALARPRTLVLLGHGENSIFDVEEDLRRAYPGLHIVPFIADIRDARRVREAFQEYRPAVVFHAAAHKHVPLMECNPDEAITNNVLGTARVAQAALEAGTERFVLISSDKAVSPASMMGASKRLAEEFIRTVALVQQRAFVVVRFGNVLGSRGSVVPAFQKQIERGGPITITHPDMRRFFMTIPEAVHLVLQAGGLGRGGEVFVLNMGEPIAVVDLARDLIRLNGFEPDDIPIVFTGIRPGEKLLEDLWEEDAQVNETAHKDVFHVIEADRSAAQELLPDIGAAAMSRDWAPPEAVALLLASCRRMMGRAAQDESSRRG